MAWLYIQGAWLAMALSGELHGLAWLYLEVEWIGMALSGGCMAWHGYIWMLHGLAWL
jgi:hypothetical protein